MTLLLGMLASSIAGQALPAFPLPKNAAREACELHVVSTKGFMTNEDTMWAVKKTNVARAVAIHALSPANQIELMKSSGLPDMLGISVATISDHTYEQKMWNGGMPLSAASACYLEFSAIQIDVEGGGLYSPTIGLLGELRYFKDGKLLFNKTEHITPGYYLKVKGDSQTSVYESEIRAGFQESLKQMFKKFRKNLSKKGMLK